MSRRVAALIIALGFMLWGAIVDSRGLPVDDQVICAVLFAVVALCIKD